MSCRKPTLIWEMWVESSASTLVTGDTNGKSDIFVRDREAVQTTRVSVGVSGVQALGHSYRAAISADGLSVAITSEAANLVSGDTNGFKDFFVRDRQAGQTSRVSF